MIASPLGLDPGDFAGARYQSAASGGAGHHRVGTVGAPEHFSLSCFRLP
jgi:hypothetical protein